ncbi:MAG: hypothetical protein U5K56_00455 [Halioglobus sp.]|nr:hypothetical protein [Halioglobus sp.]
MTALTDPCVKSRDRLQPWIASYRDDFDGRLLQPVFDESTGIATVRCCKRERRTK